MKIRPRFLHVLEVTEFETEPSIFSLVWTMFLICWKLLNSNPFFTGLVDQTMHSNPITSGFCRNRKSQYHFSGLRIRSCCLYIFGGTEFKFIYSYYVSDFLRSWDQTMFSNSITPGFCHNLKKLNKFFPGLRIRPCCLYIFGIAEFECT